MKRAECAKCAWKEVPKDRYHYIGNKTRFTRSHPSLGEPFTGHLIEFHEEKNFVRYPQCVTVTTKAPKEFYGYVHLKQRPNESSLKLTINGEPIPKCSSNKQKCWELMKNDDGRPQYKKDFQTQIQGRQDYTQIGERRRSGYFLKLYGNAIYFNGAVVKVRFLPTSR